MLENTHVRRFPCLFVMFLFWLLSEHEKFVWIKEIRMVSFNAMQ